MSDAELRDAAVAHLLQTTTGFLKSNGQPKPAPWPDGSAHWGPALDLLAQIGQMAPPPPPPSGLLTLRPPGWNGDDPILATSYPGFTRVSRLADCVDSTKRYLILQEDLSFRATKAQGQGRSAGTIAAAQDVVIMACVSDVPSESVYDDASSFVLEANVKGTVHLEGISSPRAVNWLTARTACRVQIAYCRVGKAYVLRNDHITGGVHPDVIQVWDQGAPNIAQDHFHAGYTYQGLSVLLAPNPKTWTMRKVLIEAQPLEPDSIKTAKGWSLAGGSVCIFGDQKVTDYTFDQCYCVPGSADGGATRKLQDVFTYGQSAPPYTLTGSGATSGDTIAWPSVPLLKGHWTFGKPSAPFVDPANVGLGYQPVGYA